MLLAPLSVIVGFTTDDNVVALPSTHTLRTPAPCNALTLKLIFRSEGNPVRFTLVPVTVFGNPLTGDA